MSVNRSNTQARRLARSLPDARALIKHNPGMANGLGRIMAGGANIIEWLKNKEVQKQLLRSAGIGVGCAVALSLPFWVAGFGTLGPTGGLLAPLIQSSVYGGAVPAGSAFAMVQAAGVTGLLGSIHAGTAVVAGFGGVIMSWYRGRKQGRVVVYDGEFRASESNEDVS